MKIQRTLPPAAAPLSCIDLAQGLASLMSRGKALDRWEEDLRDYFRVNHIFLVSSGKAALAIILSALHALSGKRKVLIPAYTCFSVPSAIVKVGLSVALCDVDPQSLDFNYDDLERSLDPDVLCVIPTHLFGFPSDVQRVKRLCRDRGVFVVEDAAQGMGIRHEGGLLGTRGDVALFSFGRGKNITCGSGGMILTNSDPIAEAVRKELRKYGSESLVQALKNWVQVAAMRLLISPWLYWIPAGLPFLRLGETIFSTDFALHRMDGAHAALLGRWREKLTRGNECRREHARRLRVAMESMGYEVLGPGSSGEGGYLRLPVLVKNRQAKERLCSHAKQRGLGISPFYPSSIQDIPALHGQLDPKLVPAATILTDRLVTVPTHHLLSEHDINRVIEFFESLRGLASGGTIQSTSLKRADGPTSAHAMTRVG